MGSVAAAIGVFGEAEWIVGPHGAGLANILFASPGASVLELFSPDYILPPYWNLADAIPGLAYRYLLGIGKTRSGTAVMADITVDLDALARALDGLPTELSPEAARVHR
jgi:capsular polysaccharide biosynthesis protein